MRLLTQSSLHSMSQSLIVSVTSGLLLMTIVSMGNRRSIALSATMKGHRKALVRLAVQECHNMFWDGAVCYSPALLHLAPLRTCTEQTITQWLYRGGPACEVLFCDATILDQSMHRWKAQPNRKAICTAIGTDQVTNGFCCLHARASLPVHL